MKQKTMVDESTWNDQIKQIFNKLINAGFVMWIEGEQRTHFRFHTRLMIDVRFSHRLLGDISYRFKINNCQWYKICSDVYSFQEKSIINNCNSGGGTSLFDNIDEHKHEFTPNF